MKIYISSLHEGVPQDIHEELDASALEVESVDLKFLEKLALDGTLIRERDLVTLTGNLHSRVRHTCGRCLKENEESLDIPLHLFYDVKDKDEIDTTDDIREAVLIDEPIAYVCNTECRGLCPTCGMNLNEKKCSCREENSVTGPFADLNKIRKRTKEE